MMRSASTLSASGMISLPAAPRRDGVHDGRRLELKPVARKWEALGCFRPGKGSRLITLAIVAPCPFGIMAKPLRVNRTSLCALRNGASRRSTPSLPSMMN